MAHNCYDMTGVLHLKKVTPVILALFGAYNVDGSYPGNGQAYIAAMSDCDCSTWGNVLEELADLAGELGVSFQQDEPDDEDDPDAEEPGVEPILTALAKHFNSEAHPDLPRLIDCARSREDADVDVMFRLAQRLDDGHGLQAIAFESAWYCNKPRLFEFGGSGGVIGPRVAMFGSSTDSRLLGMEIEMALGRGNAAQAAEVIHGHVLTLLGGVKDEDMRSAIASALATSLAQPKEAPGKPTP